MTSWDRTFIAFAVCTFISASISPLFAEDNDGEVIAEINRRIQQGWQDNDVTPSARTDDSEFARRTALDIVGHIPSLEALIPFLLDSSPRKRDVWIDSLLSDPDYVNHWTTIWGNQLVGRGNRRNSAARTSLDRWLRQALAENRPYDRFAHDLIAATGSSDDLGAVSFLASHLNDQATPATAITARIFLGMQVQCTQCHNHPFNDWKQSQFWGLNAFFRGSRRQNVNNGRTIYLSDDLAEDVVFFEKRSGTMEAVARQFVDGSFPPQTIVGPRQQLAALIVTSENPYLARALVNRQWAHFLGAGFTSRVDDLGPHNPASHPELLEYLAAKFRENNYDQKRLIRWITLSDAYQLTSSMNDGNRQDDPLAGNVPLFSRRYVKPFTAEQLYDSMLIATSAHLSGRNYQNSQAKRDEWLQQFVQLFGTDENDEADTFNGTVPQALVLMNGELVRSAINGQTGSFLRSVFEGRVEALNGSKVTRRDRSQLPNPKSISGRIETLFLAALSRRPSKDELQALSAAYAKAGGRDPVVGLQDVFWCLLNSNEFILNH